MVMAQKHTDATVTVVGAGPAGLAAAACLTRLSIPYTILEREDCSAPIWRKYSYDRLHLHLTKDSCHLPHHPMPPHFPTYPSRDEFLAYLTDYTSEFGIQPKYRRRVVSGEYDERRRKWKVMARRNDRYAADEVVEEYESEFVVVATGESCDPHVPEMEGLGGFPGEALHSTMYKNGLRFGGKNVLVVGSGNSGMEIALDLAECGAKTSIVVRSPMHILSRTVASAAFSLVRYLRADWVEKMLTYICRLIYGDLSKYGITRPHEGPFTVKRKYGKYPVIDVGTVAKIKSGQIEVLPGIRSIKGNNVVFENEKEYPFDVIIFATGFKPATKQWLKGADSMLNDDGFAKMDKPPHWKGENGLYCVGLGGRGLYGILVEAQSVAQDIKAQVSV